MEVNRILVTPRWSGTIDSDWYPWIAGAVPEIVRVPLPDRDAPTPLGCSAAFGAALAEGDPARTVLVGHSVSCQGWLHALAERDVRVAGFLAVAGWWSIDRPWPTIQPWLDAAVGIDCDVLQRRLGAVRVLVGTEDPFTSDQASNARLWRERLGADIRVVDSGRHFNERQEPEVLAALGALLEALRPKAIGQA